MGVDDLAGRAEDWLGVACRDRITGFAGIATAVVFRLGTGPQIHIESPTPTGDAKSRWIDLPRVERSDGDPPGVYA